MKDPNQIASMSVATSDQMKGFKVIEDLTMGEVHNMSQPGHKPVLMMRLKVRGLQPDAEVEEIDLAVGPDAVMQLLNGICMVFGSTMENTQKLMEIFTLAVMALETEHSPDCEKHPGTDE